MKLKNIKIIVGLLMISLLGISCNKDFIELDPKGDVPLEDNYYANDAEVYSGVIAVYDILGKESSTFENMITMMNAGSDDYYAGGGGATDGTGIQSFSDYSISESTIPSSFWSTYYQGIFRANVLLTQLPEAPITDANRVRYTAETKTLRAYYYFQLVRMFKNIPLILERIPTADIYNVPQVAPEAVYAQIEQDLVDAKTGLPNNLTDVTTEAGRLTKGSAQALLGKVYLYQGKNTEAATEFAEVNGTPGGTSTYGYKLVDNFADLWNIENKFNSEAIIEVASTDKANVGWGEWGDGRNDGNTINTMVAPRSISRPSGSTAPDYASGWSFNTVTLDLYDVLKDDPRFEATIADFKALKAAGQIDYIPGYKDTGYFLNKFMPLNSEVTTGGGEPILNYRQNVYAIRLADTYLMEAEALGGSGARAQALLDAVRARVGLSSIPVSLDAIAKERRLELAGEGHRFFDLVRTGKAASALADRGFTAGKNEIFPIPLKEMENTIIEQNPNY
ncbi:RagB/SusD family nutrient uptake outer membrane protein [Aureibaculum sp. A20]|uniref:RagB/SusD family nutrient uptake outer membrane protein n=1 Tax=Aureibaculum flavum TaxID=2795986 RepID=A0ABS0WTF5_9FLAO|nr:RagB/SusD family nutrient uptake outer membrane protein [Aureibaculum flavum]MBJ2175272.1 RagB/SusD family nutrient uptake outer membrane protein [Aureibaculum flavum]